MSDPKFHHYLPVFYQARWINPETKKLRRFSKPRPDKFVARWVSPKESGGEEFLYTDPEAKDDKQHVERKFMSKLDSEAAEALVMLENDNPRLRRESAPRSAWSRFLMSLMMRMPDHVDALQEGLTEDWHRKDNELAMLANWHGPRSSDEMRSWTLSVLKNMMNHELINEMLNNKRWFIRRIDGDTEFLTSDRPLITWYELAASDSYIILPIGPKAAFVAVNNVETQRRIESRPAEEWIAGLNRTVIGAARRFVFARDDRAMPLVEAHFGDRQRTNLFGKLRDLRRRQAGP